jgi:hypothetical protein
MDNQALQNELKSGERLLWSGQPQGGIRFRTYDIFFIPFSLMWGGFAIFWELGVLFMFSTASSANNAPPLPIRIIFPIFGIPFVLVGLYMIFGRFIVDARSREKTYYGVTDQRILIVSHFFGHKVQSLNLKNLPELVLNQKSDGSGTITFGSSSPFAAWGGGQWPGSQRYQSPSFEMVQNVREVYDIIQAAQQRAS